MTGPGAAPGSGERIGAYEIQGLLGRGGMGEVFLAWDARLRRRVAIKRIRHDHGLNPAMRQRLLREARAVAGLSHPAIVQVYDLLEEATGDCIVLEYVEGRTLAATLVEGGRLEPEAAVRLGREIAEGLAAAHAAGIVHRDLKAENVIVTPSGRAKILDFGLAHTSVQSASEPVITQHGALLGTFHTMSPEQASGERADERSDLFSLGILLYEMLTGRSPFRGKSPTETLRKVLSEYPPKVDVVRPGLPARLGDLVARLLAKDPANRPGSAAEVVRELEAVTAALVTSEAPTLEASVSDLPTVVEVPRPAVSQPVAPHPGAHGSTAGMSVLRRHHLREIAIAALLVAIGAVGFLFLRWRSGPTKPAAVKPVRVLILAPQVTANDDRLRLAASGMLTASLNTLASLQGITPVDPFQLQRTGLSLAEMERAVAADEILFTNLESAGSLGRITLRRIRTSNGQALWSDTFDVMVTTQDLYSLAEAVQAHVRRAFSSFPQRSGTLTLDPQDEDYAAFLEIKQRIDSGQAPSKPELALLEPIIARSPRFLAARLVAAEICNTLYLSTREISYLDRGYDLIQQAQALAPGDPRPLFTRFRLEIAAGQTPSAQKTLEQLESLLPGDPQILGLRATLADQQGRPKEALAHLRAAAELLPSWKNLYSLADLEAQTGDVEGARKHLDLILKGSPRNLWAREELAKIELLYGDLGRAEDLYQDLIRQAPNRSYFTNLGLVQVLLGHYEQAILTSQQALALDPDHPTATLNLADAESALGRAQEAQEHYRKVLKHIDRNTPHSGLLSPGDSMTRAQCLAHLGHLAEAEEIARQVLAQKPDDGELLQQAALVYALAGDRQSTLSYIRAALMKGVQPRWFKLPAYAFLREDPEFRGLIEKAPEAGPADDPRRRGVSDLRFVPIPSPRTRRAGMHHMGGGPLVSMTRRESGRVNTSPS